MKKILLIILAVVVAAVLVGVFIYRQQSGYTKVLTARIVRQDLSTIVSGTGQIKPKTYANLGATSMGRVTHLYVKEGDLVKKGQTVATIENVQQEAGVSSQRAAVAAAKTDIDADIAAEKTAQANVERARADLEQKRLDWERAQGLYSAGIMWPLWRRLWRPRIRPVRRPIPYAATCACRRPICAPTRMRLT